VLLHDEVAGVTVAAGDLGKQTPNTFELFIAQSWH